MVAYVLISMPQEFTNRESAFESQISLRAGQYLVVGQVGLDGLSFRPNLKPFPDSQPGEDLILYYVMMAEHAS